MARPMTLPPGIPAIADYLRLPESPDVREMEAYSERFLATNRRHLRAYRWAADPMRQWSRRWEYPFVFERLKGRLAIRGGGATDGPMVLDAGSGITFFPYFLASKGLRVHCCDADRSLERLFARVNASMGVDVPFSARGLADLAHADASLDAVCCVSVLEHCADRRAILAEFARVLRPGGLLVLTFDVSLDGRWEIPLPQARDLLEALGERFAPEGGRAPASLLEVAREDEILTTRFAQRHDPRSLPWGVLSDLKSLATLRRPRRPHKLLTCCALAARSAEGR
jgi:SAM-dependent methyltransferase